MSKWLLLAFLVALASLGASIAGLFIYWFFVVGFPPSTKAAYIAIAVAWVGFAALIIVFRVLPNLPAPTLQSGESMFDWALRLLWTSNKVRR